MARQECQTLLQPKMVLLLGLGLAVKETTKIR